MLKQGGQPTAALKIVPLSEVYFPFVTSSDTPKADLQQKQARGVGQGRGLRAEGSGLRAQGSGRGTLHAHGTHTARTHHTHTPHAHGTHTPHAHTARTHHTHTPHTRTTRTHRTHTSCTTQELGGLLRLRPSRKQVVLANRAINTNGGGGNGFLPTALDERNGQVSRLHLSDRLLLSSSEL